MTNGVSVLGEGWGTTIIDGAYLGDQPVIYVPGGVDATTVISGVQVTRGGTGNPSTSTQSGGIYIDGGSPKIINTWANANTGRYGGGVEIWGGTPTLTNVPLWNNRGVYGGGMYIGALTQASIDSDTNGTNGTVSWNSGDWGGGIYLEVGSAQISGLRIWWNAATEEGGGIYVVASPSVRIGGNSINWNSARSAGGGVYLTSAEGWLDHNTLVGNVVTDTGSCGGGVFLRSSWTSVNVRRNLLEANSAVFGGGGLCAQNGAQVAVDANVIVSNTVSSSPSGASGGAGVRVDSGGPMTITNNIIARNVLTPDVTASAGAGIEIVSTPVQTINNTVADNKGSGLHFYTSNGIVIANNIIADNTNYGIYAVVPASYTIANNDVYANTAGHYQWVTPGPNNLSLDPLFVGTGNMAAFYHLQSASPVRAKGSLAYAPPFDIDGEPRTVCVSMGADQIAAQRLMLPLIVR